MRSPVSEREVASAEGCHHEVVEEGAHRGKAVAAEVGDGKVYVAEQDGKYGGKAVHKQRVDAERLEKAAPTLMAFYVDNPYEKTEQRGGESAGGEHEGGRPYFFVERASVGEQEAGECEDDANDEQSVDAQGVVLGRHDQPSAKEADKAVGDRGQGGEQAFGVEFQPHSVDFRRVYMVGAKHFLVDDGEDIIVGELKTVTEDKNQEIAEKQQYDCPCQLPTRKSTARMAEKP